MAKLVQKSGYIKSGKAGGYMRYIATREGVEKLAGNSAVTKGQRELIQKLLHDFPDAVELFEYEDYCRTPTLGTASAFISMALDAKCFHIIAHLRRAFFHLLLQKTTFELTVVYQRINHGQKQISLKLCGKFRCLIKVGAA